MVRPVTAAGILRTVASVALAGMVVLGAATAAEAHVTVSPNTAASGTYVRLTFDVPTESVSASTTKVEIDLPTDHPFGSVSYQAVPGWTTRVTTSRLATPVTTDDGTITEAPSKIVWTAGASAGIGPGQFQTFVVSVGPVPDTGSVEFLAHQTYSDGSVVSWDQPTPASGVEPDHPAPTLYINSAPPAESAAGTAAAGAKATVSSAPSTPTASAPSDSAARWIGVAGLAVGSLALVLAAYAVTRPRRASS